MKIIVTVFLFCIAVQYSDVAATTYNTASNSSINMSQSFDRDWLLSLKKPDEGLIKALVNYYKLPEPIARVFFCLALSNTKRFQDAALMEANNLYCLCDESNLGRYYQYQHWSESVDDILSLYREELGKDFLDITDLLDCIASHYDREKTIEMSKYHELYFDKKLPIRSSAENERRRKKGGLPW